MKRYPTYKDSGVKWLGDIPEHWKRLTIRRITEDHKQGFYSSEGYDNEGFRLVRITDLDDSGNIDTISSPFVKLTDSEEKVFRIRKGDFLFPRTGSIGLLGVATQDLNAAFASYLIRFRFTQNALPSFMKFYFMSDVFLNGLLSDLHGGVNQNIHAENIKDQYLALPPTPEQEGIAAFLDQKTKQIDTLISNKEKLIELLKEERTAIINQAVIKGLNPNVPMKDSGIEWLGEIPEHWEVKKLKYVSKINPSKPSYNFDRNCNEEVVFLPMEKVSEEGSVDQSLKRSISDVSSGFTYFEKDDVIVAKITPCFENGKGALLSGLETDFGYGSTEFHTIRATIEISKEFILYVTRSERFMTLGEAFMTGSAGQKRVPTSFVENFHTCIPPLDEQIQIVEFTKQELLRFDAVISIAKQEIKLLKEYKAALISEVVTGKIDVREEVFELV